MLIIIPIDVHIYTSDVLVEGILSAHVCYVS